MSLKGRVMLPDYDRDEAWVVPDFVPADWITRYGTAAASQAVVGPERPSHDMNAVGLLRLIGNLAVAVVSIAAIAWPVTGVAAVIAAVCLIYALGEASAELAQMVLRSRVNNRTPRTGAGRSRLDPHL
jgi:hypothetical protein